MGLPTEIHPITYAGVGKDYKVANSLRFRASASPRLSYLIKAGGNQTTFTFSAWIKRGRLSTTQYIFSSTVAGGGQYSQLYLTSSNELIWTNQAAVNYQLTTTQLFRDPSAWYHIMLVVNTSSSSASITGVTTDRQQLWVNGVQISAMSRKDVPPQNFAGYINRNGYSHYIGDDNSSGTPFDGYMAEINFVDGQALTASSFGQTDSVTGIWGPKKYTGTYGTNGFYLPFNDATSTTTIGYDRQLGMSDSSKNNWTASGISVTSGVTYDVMIDSPTAYNDGGNNRGNYPTLNAVDPANRTLSDGNLKVTGVTTNACCSKATMVITGKTYWECQDLGTNIPTYGNFAVGICKATLLPTTAYYSAGAISVRDYEGNFYRDGTTNPAGVGAPYGAGSTNDIYMLAYDPSTTSLWIGRNGTWFNSGNPASGTGAVSTVNLGDVVPMLGTLQSGDTGCINFGQRPFTYTPPAGFKALNTYNLANPSLPLV